jgi:Second Messenger Oligonucleotide or Dinucleotide Synthetase domain
LLASRSHRRLAAFIDWIKPESETRDAIRKQGGDIRRVISGQATADGLVVVETPEAGSFAKHTGLRRHMRGHSEVEGQDVDLPLVVKPESKDGTKIDALLHRFDRYAEASYPNTPREITASSVELRFVASRLARMSANAAQACPSGVLSAGTPCEKWSESPALFA